MGDPNYHFDNAYRGRIEDNVLEAIMTTRTDSQSKETTLRSVEAVDALLSVISLIAPMQVTSRNRLDSMMALHQRVLKERTVKYFEQYKKANGPLSNIRREFR